MSRSELRDRFTDILLERIQVSDYPSRELMDRMEFALDDTEDAARYVEVLFEKVQGKYPSLELLDRIDMMVRVIESAESRLERERELHEEMSSSQS